MQKKLTNVVQNKRCLMVNTKMRLARIFNFSIWILMLESKKRRAVDFELFVGKCVVVDL